MFFYFLCFDPVLDGRLDDDWTIFNDRSIERTDAQSGRTDIAIARVEQVTPFPFDKVAKQIKLYHNAEVGLVGWFLEQSRAQQRRGERGGDVAVELLGLRAMREGGGRGIAVL